MTEFLNDHWTSNLFLDWNPEKNETNPLPTAKRSIDETIGHHADLAAKKFASSVHRGTSNTCLPTPVSNSVRDEFDTNNPLTIAEIARAAHIPNHHRAPKIRRQPNGNIYSQYLSGLKPSACRGKPVISSIQGREGERSHPQVKVRNEGFSTYMNGCHSVHHLDFS